MNRAAGGAAAGWRPPRRGLAAALVMGALAGPVGAAPPPSAPPASQAAQTSQAAQASAPQRAAAPASRPAASASASSSASSSASASAASSVAASSPVPRPAAAQPATPRPAATAAAASRPAASQAATPRPATVQAAAPRPAASQAQAEAPNPAAFCEKLVRKLPNLSTALCTSAQLVASGGRSVQGQPLYQRDVVARFTDSPAQEAAKGPRRPRVLVIGGIHGDELSSTSLVFHWIAHALETGADMDWRFVPAVNPDGLLLPRPSRMNARGVDLNRNFPTPHWDRDAPEYWAKRTRKDPRRYPGASALSEPETRFIQETMDRWKPDVIVSIHAPYGVLDYDGPSVPPQRLGRLFLDRVGIFPGSLGHYGGVHRGVPVVTIELPSAIRTPTNAEMRQMWLDLLRWIGERLAVAERR